MQRTSIIPVIGLLLVAGCQSGDDQSNAMAMSNDTAQSADSAGPTSADIDAVQSFTLTDAYLAKYEAYQDEAVKDPCALSPMVLLGKNDGKNLTLDQTVAEFESQPGVPAALQRAGLSAHDLILGMTTLLSAAVQDIAAKHPDMVEKGEIKSDVKVSPANMTFYHQHQQALHDHNTALAKEQLAANGGKLPSCLTGDK